MTQLPPSSPDPAGPGAPPGARPGPATTGLPIEALQDVELKVEVVLGRARLALRELLEVHPGSTIELDRSRNSPVDVLVNGTLFARGDIVVIDDAELGVQIEEVVAHDGVGR
ncbi:MAG TPA: FliM/FliN family flagellar motor switch protein [Acidimicrobiales bacterium]|jgi:flagellar motor switch protein FliN/FliY